MHLLDQTIFDHHPDGMKQIHFTECEKCNEQLMRIRIMKNGSFVSQPIKHRCKPGYVPVVHVPDEDD
jgi:hypothetical protein